MAWPDGVDARGLLEAFDAIVWKADAESLRLSFVTRAGGRLGYSPSDWTKPGFFAQRLHPDERDLTLLLFRAVVEGGMDRDLVHRMVCADGTTRWFRTHLTVAGRRRGRALVGCMFDITERVATETVLREGETRMRLMFEQIPGIVFTTDRDLRFTSGVGAGLKTLGLQQDKTLIGVPIQHYLLLRDPNDPLLGHYRRALAGEATRYEHEWLGRSYSTHVEPFRDPSGAIVGTIAVALDVTEAKRAREALRLIADASATLVESIDLDVTLGKVARLLVPRFADACIVFTQEGESLRRVAAAHAEPSKEPLLEIVPQQYALDAMGGIAQAIRAGKPVLLREVTDEMLAGGAGGPLAITAGDAPFFECFHRLGIRSFVGVPLLARGRTLGAVVLGRAGERPGYVEADLDVAQEVCRRCALAIDNAALYRDAQDAIQLRDEFLSVASHELHTPLTSALLRVHQLRREASRGIALDASKDGGLAVVERQTKRLAELVDRLLDVSRMRPGALSLELEDVDLAEVARDIATRLEVAAVRAGCTLEVRADRPALGRWDRVRMEQLLSNLLSNAIKFGRGKPVEVAVECERDRARVVVRDHGVGIAPEDQARIFGRFERAAPSAAYGGLGLGLYVARRIVEAHGGTLDVESAPGEGATFVVELPRGATDAVTTGASSPRGG